MEWLFKMIEAGLNGLGSLAANGLASAGERVGDKVLPSDRPMDVLKTRRRLKGDMAELYKLYSRLTKYTGQAEETYTAVCKRAVRLALDPTPDDPARPIVNACVQLCRQLLRDEGYFPLPQIDFTRELSLGKTWELTALTRRCLAFYETQNHREEVGAYLTLMIKKFLPALPADEGEEALGLLPLYALSADFAVTTDGFIRYAVRTGKEDGLLSRLGEQLFHNVLLASGIDPRDVEESNKMPVMPGDREDKSPSALVDTYLAQTPFVDFFTTETVPFCLPLDSRFEHMHIVGGSGHGKTQTLQNLFLSDLARVGDGERSVIVIDSQGDMIHNILKLAAVGELSDRVVLIYPKDLKYPPALNLFDFGLERLNRYNEVEQEMLINGAIALYEYVFGALLGAALTQRQGVIFRYLARLMMVVPGATIHTFMDFMQEPDSVRPHLAKLDDPITRRFFETQFFSKAFDDTRQQILTRLWGVLSNRTLARMFEGKRNKVNLFDSMGRGSIILIHTAKDLLKQEGCEILGRFFIALIAQAAQERASIPPEQRTPTFVYIDEAHDYFDESMENLLNQARKYNVGVILAHQNLDQFEQKLHASVMASTSIKMVGGLSAKDAGAFAREMGCDREFLQSMRKEGAKTQFACLVKNSTPSPITLTVPLGKMTKQPVVNPYVFKALIERNRQQYCTDATGEHPPHEPGSPEGDDSPLGDPELL